MQHVSMNDIFENAHDYLSY